MKRNNRGSLELRPVRIKLDAFRDTAGSAEISMGHTKVLVGVSMEKGVPNFLQGKNQGWITAEYAMLPASTNTRSSRRPSGRSQEIQRLIGRSLRSIADLEALDGYTLIVDCDVIQADGGTRTASITGAWVALAQACNKMLAEGLIAKNPLRDQVAAISAGVVDDQVLLDLAYLEDSQASVDMNVVMTGKGKFVEVQGTAEGDPFSRAALDKLLAAAKTGILELIEIQQRVLKGKT